MKKALFAFLLFILVPSLLLAQGYDKNRGREKAEDEAVKVPIIELQLERIALGFGSFFDNENVTFSTDALYLSVQLHGIALPFIKEGTSTGITFEGHPGKVFTKAIEGGYEQLLENVDWRLWSTTRIPISAMPIRALQSGSLSRMFAGTDLLIAEGGPEDFTGDFDARFVFGGDLGLLGPGNTVFEIYMFQQDVPIAFAIFYGF